MLRLIRLALKESALYLKLAEKTVYKLVAAGKFPALKRGSWRFEHEDVENWISKKKGEAGKNEQEGCVVSNY